MIDSEERQAMRQRAGAARRAVELVHIHADDGLHGELPAEQCPPLLTSAVASARDVPRLLGEVERLEPAAYVFGLQACKERECDHVDWDGDPNAECPEVEHRVATLADVKRAEYLEALVEALGEAARRLDRGEDPDPSGEGRDLTTLILEGAENTNARFEQWQNDAEEPTW